MGSPTHSIQAYYAGGPGDPYFRPVMACGCGWSTGRCETWAEAAVAYDEHLAEATKDEETQTDAEDS